MAGGVPHTFRQRFPLVLPQHLPSADLFECQPTGKPDEEECHWKEVVGTENLGFILIF